MNNYQVILQVPYVKFAIWQDNYKLIKNKFRNKCKKCQCVLTEENYVLWREGFGCICAADCLAFIKNSGSY